MREFDFLVVGSGIAGLTFALRAAKAGTVAVVTKKESMEANTNYAQGGIAAVFSPDDSPQRHMEDTISAGGGLSHPEAVKIMVEEGPFLVDELYRLGTHFDVKGQVGNDKVVFDLWREGGHTRRRIVHAQDHTGEEIEKTLVERVAELPSVSMFENHLALDLIMGTDGRCRGGVIFDTKTGEIEPFFAKITLLATGGVGQIYLHTTNPMIATGDGIAIAFRAGAKIANMEFVQFHPTALYLPYTKGRKFLISEAVRGEGAILRTQDGNTFMEKYDERGCLAPRDVVARAIDMELKKRGEEYVYLDLSPIPPHRIKEKFPRIYETCLELGIDITKEMIPVVPAAHYLCGGIMTDIDGCTSIPGLFAAGEVAHTGVHGANRLASNSLLEALVFSKRAAQKAIEEVKNKTASVVGDVAIPEYGKEEKERVFLAHECKEIKRIMWDYVGIVRSDERLEKALCRLSVIWRDVEDLCGCCKPTREIAELRSMATTARIVAFSAMLRKESRGLHFNVDHPERDDVHWKKDTIITKEELR